MPRAGGWELHLPQFFARGVAIFMAKKLNKELYEVLVRLDDIEYMLKQLTHLMQSLLVRASKK